LLYKDSIAIKPSHYKWYILINSAVIFLNTTRGAILILFLLVSYKIINNLFVNRNILYTTLLSFVFVGFFVSNNESISSAVLGNNFNALANYYYSVNLDDLQFAESEITHNNFIEIGQFSTSSSSRIFSNYYGLLAFLNNPWFGIGSAKAYSIEVMGNGIHSFIFLFIVSTGLIGVTLFLIVLRYISKIMGPLDRGFVLFLFAFSVLQFENYLPTYFVLLFILGSLSNVYRKQSDEPPIRLIT